MHTHGLVHAAIPRLGLVATLRLSVPLLDLFCYFVQG